MKPIIRSLAFLLTALAVSGPAIAQTYPSKPIRVLLGFPAGSAVDIASRALSVHMQKQLGQPLVIESRAGAGGYIAVNAVAKAEPDGYMIHFGLLGSLLPALVKNTPVDARKELTAISDSISAPLALYGSAKLPARTFQELVAYAKANAPGTVNYASAAATQALLMQLVNMRSGLTYTLINYPGAPAVIPALIKGEVGLSFNVLGPFLPHLEAGTIRVLFITGPKRMARFPNIPTAAEVGIPGLVSATSDLGWWAPRGTPKDVIDKLSKAAIDAVRTPEIIDLFQRQGYEALGSTPEEQLRRYEANFQFWSETARLTNFTPQ